jgi:hypothetical protein
MGYMLEYFCTNKRINAIISRHKMAALFGHMESANRRATQGLWDQQLRQTLRTANGLSSRWVSAWISEASIHNSRGRWGEKLRNIHLEIRLGKSWAGPELVQLVEPPSSFKWLHIFLVVPPSFMPFALEKTRTSKGWANICKLSSLTGQASSRVGIGLCIWVISPAKLNRIYESIVSFPPRDGSFWVICRWNRSEALIL